LRDSTGIISSAPIASESDETDDPSGDVEWRKVFVGNSQHGGRLDRALVEAAPEFSRSYLQQMIEMGLISVNSQLTRKAARKVKAGDTLLMELRPTPQSQAFTPQTMDLTVVFEDDHILVINKPAGLVVHPAPGNWSGTLLNGLLAYDAGIALVPRAGIVHRLDKDTSGLMVVARSRVVMDKLVQAIAAREVSRQYLAVAHRPWIGTSHKTVESPIGRDPRNRLRMAVVDLEKQPGKSAKTDFILLANGEIGCLVRCNLHTGRTHQIRVHMASLGHSLIADMVYGGTCLPGMTRQALHAARLAFLHPVTQEPVVCTAPPPADFVSLLNLLGLRYNEQV
jgi:23S rRNA pseudouridine1911/1915/1917 synthase